ncbi:hypothetical protein J6590_071929 [Homalodisca vitripennis]|nr:hypothetical protein J6590_071929 [Homalodisca vitripennis]
MSGDYFQLYDLTSKINPLQEDMKKLHKGVLNFSSNMTEILEGHPEVAIATFQSVGSDRPFTLRQEQAFHEVKDVTPKFMVGRFWGCEGLDLTSRGKSFHLRTRAQSHPPRSSLVSALNSARSISFLHCN